MVPHEARRALRAATYRGDGAAVLATLGGSVPEALLQYVGDGLLVALAQHQPEARALADRCAEQLRSRGWCGDHELASELGAAMLDQGSSLRAVPVDLEELSDLLESSLGEGGGQLDLESGEVWSASAIEYVDEADEELPDFEAEGRWLYVDPQGSDEGYRDKQGFIATMSDDDRTDHLAIAIEGRGAFGRYKDVLARWPEDEERWYRFSDERRRGRAREWLAQAGYRPAVPNQPRDTA